MEPRLNVGVRRATAADLPAIVRIYNHAVDHSVATFDIDPVDLEERTSWFMQFDDTHPIFTCELSGQVAGYAYYLPFRQKPAYAKSKECTVYVAAEHRQKGVGSALYEAIIAYATASGVHALVGVLGGDNPASVALHRRFGFEKVGHLREVGHKFGQYVDTHYFQKLLDSR